MYVYYKLVNIIGKTLGQCDIINGFLTLIFGFFFICISLSIACV